MEYHLKEIVVYVAFKPVIRLTLRVKRDGSVHASVPLRMPSDMAFQFICEHEQWIRRTRERILSRPLSSGIEPTAEQVALLRQYLHLRVSYWQERMGEDYAPLTWKLRKMRTQWGNCRKQRRLITFSSRLALVDKEDVDYVIVHELSHLLVPNHSASFYARVEHFLPDWKERRKHLHYR